jgi:glycine reductase
MRLTLAIHEIGSIAMGVATRLDGDKLEVDPDELRKFILEDGRLESVDIETVAPGEECRIGVVYDIIEPRAKEPGSGSDFPGILGPIEIAGQGTTHVLRGASVTTVDDGAALENGKILEMTGPAGDASPYTSLHHLVITPHPIKDLERHTALAAIRLASVTAAVYLARCALGITPDSAEIFDSEGPAVKGREGLPRFAYIGQVHSRQRVAEIDEKILYGDNTAGLVPVSLHPNEWLDGAVVTCNRAMGAETYFYQNHPVITELYRRHQRDEITFVGTLATVAASDNEERDRICMMAAEQAKWNLAADGVVMTKYGGGAPHADMSQTARRCEELGIRTTVQVSDMSWDRRVESALLFNYPEVDAIVYVGGRDTEWQVPASARVIAGNGELAEDLGAPQTLAATNVCGVSSQQGISRLRSMVH